MNLTPQNITKLKVLIPKDLPGVDAHYEMAPGGKKFYQTPGKNYKEAAVLITLYPIDDIWHILFMERTSSNPNDKHNGQISFPGGKLETTDNSLEKCAVREAHEEVGLKPEKVEILGQLTPIFVSVSNFMVTPFLALYPNRPTFTLQKSEVQSILEIPISHLLDKQTRQIIDMKVRGYLIKNLPIYDLYGKILWGATAMITNEVLHLIKKTVSGTK